MRIVISKTGRFLGRLSVQVVPSVTASVLGGYLLAQLVPQHGATSATPAATSRPDDNVPVVNDRAPIRVVPLPRSAQASEPPAEVKRAEAKPAAPKPEARSEAKSEAKSSDAKSPDAKSEAKTEAKAETKPETKSEIRSETRQAAVAPEAKVSRARPAPAAVQQVYTPEPYTPEADLPQVASQPVLSAAPVQPVAPKPQQPAPQSAPSVVASAPALPAPTSVGPGAGAPTALSPVVVNAPRPAVQQPASPETVASAAPAPQRERGVFSAISNAAGTAANVTGDTINWVIDLPGKLIGQDNADNRQQQASQPRRFM